MWATALPKLALTYTGLVDGESVTPSQEPDFTITKSDNTEITLADAVKTAGTYTITWSNAGNTTFPRWCELRHPDGNHRHFEGFQPVCYSPHPPPTGPSTGSSDGWEPN